MDFENDYLDSLIDQCINRGYNRDEGKIKNGKWVTITSVKTNKGNILSNSSDCFTKLFKEYELVRDLVLYQMIGKSFDFDNMVGEIYGDPLPYSEDDDEYIDSIVDVKVKGPEGIFDLSLIDKDLARELVTEAYQSSFDMDGYVGEEIVDIAFGEVKQR